jgi:hypothetical protein
LSHYSSSQSVSAVLWCKDIFYQCWNRQAVSPQTFSPWSGFSRSNRVCFKFHSWCCHYQRGCQYFTDLSDRSQREVVRTTFP